MFCVQIYRVMCNAGYAEKDFSSAFQFLKEQEKNNWQATLIMILDSCDVNFRWMKYLEKLYESSS